MQKRGFLLVNSLPLLVCNILVYQYCTAQQTHLSGTVFVHNSLYETGVRKFVVNAQVEDDFDKAQPSVTDINGNFRLTYVGIEDKQSVSFTVTKPGWEVVNFTDLQAITGQLAKVRISMARPAQIAEFRTKIYNIGKTEAESQLTTLIKSKESELSKLKKQAIQHTTIIRQLEEDVTVLKGKYASLEVQARDLAKFYERINLDDATPYYQQAFREFLNGKFDSAMKTLMKIDYDRAIDQLAKESRLLRSLNKEITTRDSIYKATFLNTVNSLRLKLEIHRTRFEFDSTSRCFELLLSVDTSNVNLLLEYAIFNSRLKRDLKAIKLFEALLTMSKSDSLNAVAYTELGTIYYARNQFEKAEELFSRSLKIQSVLFARDSSSYGLGLANTQVRMGNLYLSKNDFSQAERMLDLASKSQMFGRGNFLEELNSLSAINSSYGHLERVGNNYRESEISLLKSIELLRKGISEKAGEFEKDLIKSLCALGNLYLNASEFGKAEQYFIEANGLATQLLRVNRAVYEPIYALVLFETSIADFFQKRDSAGLTKLSNAINILQQHARKDPELYEINLCMANEMLGSYFLNTGKQDSSLRIFNDLNTIYHRYVVTNPKVFEPFIANTQMKLGMIELNRRNYTLAINLLDDAQQIYYKFFLQNPEPFKVRLADVLYTKATLFQNSQRADSAIFYYSAAIRLYDSIVQRNSYVKGNEVQAYYNMGKIELALGKLKDAMLYLTEAKKTQKILADLSDVHQAFLADIQTNLGILFVRMNDFFRSKMEFSEALIIQKNLAQTSPEALPQLAGILYESYRVDINIHDYKAAERKISDALELQRSLALVNKNYEPYLVTIINSLAYLKSFQGDFATACQLYRECISIQEKLTLTDSTLRPFLADLIFNLSVIYAKIDKTDSALIWQEKALRIQQELAKQDFQFFKQRLAEMLESKGYIHVQLGQAVLAEDIFQKAVLIVDHKIFSAENFEYLRLRIKLGLAKAYIMQRRFSEAIGILDQVVSNFQSFKVPELDYEKENLALLYLRLGLLYSDMRRFDDALYFYKRAVSLQKPVADKSQMARSQLANMYCNMGFAYSNKNDFAATKTEMSNAIEVIQSLPENEGTQFLLQSIFSSYAKMLYTLDRSSEAQVYNIKARLILKKLARLKPILYQPLLARFRFDEGLYFESKEVWYAEECVRSAIRLQEDYVENYKSDSLMLVHMYAALARIGRSGMRRDDLDSLLSRSISYTKTIVSQKVGIADSYLAIFLYEKWLLYKNDVSINSKARRFLFDAMIIQEKLANLDSLNYQPFLVTFFDELAMSYARDGRWDSSMVFQKKMLTLLDQLILSNPTKFFANSIMFYLNAINLYATQQKYQEAQELVEKILGYLASLVPNDQLPSLLELARLRYAYANVLKAQSKISLSIMQYLEAIKFQEKFEKATGISTSALSYLHLDLAVAHKLNGDMALAFSAFNKAQILSDAAERKDFLLIERIKTVNEELRK